MQTYLKNGYILNSLNSLFSWEDIKSMGPRKELRKKPRKTGLILGQANL